MRPYPVFLASVAFVLAASLALLTAVFTAGAIEKRAERETVRLFNESGIDWATVTARGLLVELTGTAPNEAGRYRAVSLAGRVVDGGRVIDLLEVTPTSAMTAPRFSMELLRNDDGVSAIGLVPASWDHAAVMGRIDGLVSDGEVIDMLENADFAIPDGWVDAVAFGLRALESLPRSKISIAADGVTISAIADSAAEKQRLEAELSRDRPDGIRVSVSISAPRQVIAPFILRFVVDEAGPRFDACSADTPRASSRILAAAQALGMPSGASCTLGLGAPSPRWADASIASIRAMGELGAGVVTISDVDVTLIAAETVTQDQFDKVVGDLTSALPDVFSLKATLTPKADSASNEETAQFTATLSPEGQVQLRGRLRDERMREMVEAYAIARFGASAVSVSAGLDEQVPGNWGVRVLTALGALAELGSGSALVLPDRLDLRGVTGKQGARQEISRLVSERLGQGQAFVVDVRYDERLDPTLGLPGPADCVRLANEVLERSKITFDPGAAVISADGRRGLTALAEVLKDCKDFAIEIGGHTDSQGSAEGNLDLSQKRADAVLRELAELGIESAVFTARGYGQEQPIADNATAEGREANRRIAFTLLQSDAVPAPELVPTTGEVDRAPDEVAGLVATDPAQAPDDIDNSTLTWTETGTISPRPARRDAERQP